VRKNEEYAASALDTLQLAEQAGALEDLPERVTSPRVQKCLDRAQYCEEAASVVTTDSAKATFVWAARSWREMAERYAERERIEAVINARHPGLLGADY
jgi:hypothetical protein